jgi:hypothetical protein
VGLAGQGEGTFYFDNFACVLDQLLVNKNMAKQNSPIQALADTIQMVRLPRWWMRAGTVRSRFPSAGWGSLSTQAASPITSPSLCRCGKLTSGVPMLVGREPGPDQHSP